MKSLFVSISLIAAVSSQHTLEAGIDENVQECCGTDQYFSGYVYYWKRGYFRGDNGEYFTVAHKDHEFRDRVADLIRQRNTEFEAVCYRVEFCGRVGGDSGDLVNKNFEVHRGINFEPIDCPSS